MLINNLKFHDLTCECGYVISTGSFNVEQAMLDAIILIKKHRKTKEHKVNMRNLKIEKLIKYEK